LLLSNLDILSHSAQSIVAQKEKSV